MAKQLGSSDASTVRVLKLRLKDKHASALAEKAYSVADMRRLQKESRAHSTGRCQTRQGGLNEQRDFEQAERIGEEG